MQLQTAIPLAPQKHNPIDYNSKLLLLGSCFAENIASKLNYFKFQQLLNPLGILFHPMAIEQLLTNAINRQKYDEEALFFLNERWHSFDAHSKLSHADKNRVLENINRAITTTNSHLGKATHIIITLGTAWVYRNIATDKIVANCHKVASKKFLKTLLTVDEIAESLAAIVALIRSVNTKASLVFTVSPVRHLKDGFTENNRSKAHLLSAVHNVVEPTKKVHYFPSYELMMDELRDYRFYAEDMLHPNELAINYIWEKFQAVWISEKAQKTMLEVAAIQKALAHKSFNPDSEQHQQFLLAQKQKMEILQKEFPFIKF